MHNAKKRPPSTETCSSVKDERMINYPRYHLVSQFALCALRNTFIFPATDVCPHVTEYLVRIEIPARFIAPSAVHLAACISTRLSPSRTLCARITAFISASTVYYTKLFYKLPHTYIFVKHFFQILLFTFFLIPYHPAAYFDIIPVETSS